MTNVRRALQPDPELPALASALQEVAAGAAARDAQAPPPAFPEEAIAALEAAGALRFNAVPGPSRPPAELELGLVRRVAAADGSVGRIYDGHLNAVERLAVQAPAAVRDRELRAVLAGELRAGVWGGDPIPGEGPPAAVIDGAGGEVLRGVKTFCSGAGGLHRALVLARDHTPAARAADAPAPPALVWIDLTDERRVEVDTGWYRSRGLVASVSHRVVFRDAPVLTRLGEPGAIAQQPWFGRDALRTAASWAGMADTAVQAATAVLEQRPARGDLESLAMGRMLTEQRTIDVWLAAAARAMDAAAAVPAMDAAAAVPAADAAAAVPAADAAAAAPATDAAAADLAAVALHGRVAIAGACRRLLDEAARACGSHPFATAGALDRARRDLEVFLLQHRLDPLLARAGSAALEGED